MVDHLDTKNFVPFSKRRSTFQLPGLRKSPDQELLEQVDPNLRPEDEGVIRRYLQYADTLLRGPDARELPLVPGGGPAKRLAAESEPTLESRFEGFNPDLLDRVKVEGEKRLREKPERGQDLPEDAEASEAQDDGKAA